MSELLDETSTDLEPTEAAAGADETEPTPGAVAEDPVEEAPTPAPEAPGIDWTNIETLREAAGVLQSMGFQLAPAQQAEPQTEQAPVELDPFADNYTEQLVNLLGQVLDQRFGPIEQFAQQQQAAEVDGRVNGLLSQVAQEAKLELGQDEQGVFRAIADSFAPAAAQASPFDGNRAARIAAERAAQWLAARDKRTGEAAVTAYKQSLGQVADTPAEPGVNGGGLTVEQRPKTYDEIIAKHVGRVSG